MKKLLFILLFPILAFGQNAKVLDICEYSTQSAAQTAYLSNAGFYTRVASEYVGEQYQFVMAVHNDTLWSGSGSTGLVVKWNQSNAWVLRAAQLNSQIYLYGMDTLYGSIYTSTASDGRLFKLGLAGNTQVAASYGTESVRVLINYHQKLYGGTIGNGYLLEFTNGGASWSRVATKLGTQTAIYCLAIHNDSLYAGTYPNGLLYVWTGSAWKQRCAQYASETYIYSICEYKGALYGSSYPTGYLLKFNEATSAWDRVALQYGTEYAVRHLNIHNGRLYGSTYGTGLTLMWDDISAWVLTAAQYSGETVGYWIRDYHNEQFVSTCCLGNLLRIDYNLYATTESSIKIQGSYSMKCVATTSALNKTLVNTLGSAVDLTGVNWLKFHIYSTRTGSNIKIGITDAGGTTTEITPNITGANAWQYVTWDLSAVADANKDAINKITITVVNADAANTFYFDNFTSRERGLIGQVGQDIYIQGAIGTVN